MRFSVAIMMTALLSTFFGQAQTINTKTSYITFEVLNMGKTVQGTMKGMRGSVQLDPNDLAAAKFDATIDPSSVDSGVKGRDKHLQRKDYFDVATFPTVRMVSKSITQTAEGYEAVATLSIKGVEQEVVVPFTVTNQGKEWLWEGSFSLQRKEYNLATDTGKALVGLEIKVHIHAIVSK